MGHRACMQPLQVSWTACGPALPRRQHLRSWYPMAWPPRQLHQVRLPSTNQALQCTLTMHITLVPALLSTYISPQDQDCIYVAQGPSSGDLTDEEEAALENMLKKQTADVEGAIEELTERMDSWRAKCKQRKAEAQAAAAAAAKDRGNGTAGSSTGAGDGRKRKRE